MIVQIQEYNTLWEFSLSLSPLSLSLSLRATEMHSGSYKFTIFAQAGMKLHKNSDRLAHKDTER